MFIRANLPQNNYLLVKIDFIIVGQGIAGTLLGLELINRGYEIRIFDPCSNDTSSNKAAGLYNPITGRKMVKTWLADELFDGLPEFYAGLEQKLGTSFHQAIPIYRPFFSIEEQNDWNAKGQEDQYSVYIKQIHQKPTGVSELLDEFGGLELAKTGFVDLPVLIEAARNYFTEKGVFEPSAIDSDELQFSEVVTYKNFTADKIIFSDGTFFSQNVFWKNLPFKPVRGEIIDIACDLPPDRIYNRGVFMLPKNGLFRIGSTYDHELLSFEPQQKGIEELQRRMTKLFSGKYELISASAGVRPATHDRRPYIGWHPENKAVGIFNGFGTKGVSLVPYFSKLFIDSFEGTAEFLPEADVSRVF